jgi:cellulose synthase/poly-beta-1,6-N-acetylglucosamine synthase-like glycosyltransferase
LARAHGEYIAIFDADFCPHSDFLLRTVPLFTDDPRLGFVQARWSYLNAEYSLVTRIQALALDGHFAVEQVARSRSGLFINFNGTGGVWRKVCIEQSGGWQSDTLCEDLDISFRAQLSGWRGIYLSDVAVPAELTPQLAAFKQQQGRWSRGSAQTLRKLFGPLLRGAKTSGLQKALGLLHLGGYLAQVLAVAFLLVTLLLWLIPGARQVPLGGLGLLAIGPPLLYAVAQQRLYRDWPRRLWAVPFLLLVGVGLSWGNTVAFIQGLTRWGGSFVRTPKFQLHGKAGRWLDSSYRASISRSLVGEAFLAGYAVLATVVAWRTGRYSAIPAMAYYALGFTTVAVIELVQITSARLARGRFRSSAPVDASSSDS